MPEDRLSHEKILIIGRSGRSSVARLLSAALEGTGASVEEISSSGRIQRLLYRFFMRPTVYIITSASDSGPERFVVPKGRAFYTSDIHFLGDADAMLVASGKNLEQRAVALSSRVLHDLGLPDEKIMSAFERVRRQIFFKERFTVGERTVINACDMDDPASEEKLFQTIGETGDVTAVLFSDYVSEHRIRCYARLFTDQNCPRVIVSGPDSERIVKFLSKNVLGSKIMLFAGAEHELLEQCYGTVVCLGSSEGRGRSFLSYCSSFSENISENM